MWMIDYAQSHKNEILSVVSESLPHLKKGSLRDFLAIMETHGYFKEANFNKSEQIYTFETGTIIEFFSADQPGKVHGPRRDVLYLNEGNNIPYNIYTQLEIRTRKIVWVDSNPTHEYWMYTEVLPQGDVDFITVTYADNEALEKSIVESIESKKGNKRFWQVYGLGQLGEAVGRIYTDWKIIEEIPHEARLMRRGLDFGYVADPSVAIDIYELNGGYIVDEVFSQKGLSNRKIADILLNREPILTIADSAEPKSIDELAGYGLSIIGSAKGPGSVLQGIQYVQDKRISVTSRSVNLIKSYRNYLWKTDKDGKILNEPSHEFSDELDALRYGFCGLREWKQLESFRKRDDFDPEAII